MELFHALLGNVSGLAAAKVDFLGHWYEFDVGERTLQGLVEAVELTVSVLREGGGGGGRRGEEEIEEEGKRGGRRREEEGGGGERRREEEGGGGGRRGRR